MFPVSLIYQRGDYLIAIITSKIPKSDATLPTVDIHSISVKYLTLVEEISEDLSRWEAMDAVLSNFLELEEVIIEFPMHDGRLHPMDVAGIVSRMRQTRKRCSLKLFVDLELVVWEKMENA